MASKKIKKPAPAKNKKVQKAATKKKIVEKKSVKKTTTKFAKKVLKKPTAKTKPAAKKNAKNLTKKVVAKAKETATKGKKIIKPALKVLTKKLVKKTAVKTTAKTATKLRSPSQKKVAKPAAKEVAKQAKTVVKAEKKSLSKIIKNVTKSSGSKTRFSVGDYAIYPSHGVGKIVGIEKSMIMNTEMSCYLMHFEKERLNIKIPVSSADQIGLRHPVTKSEMNEVFVTLRSGVKKLKGMWSRRAQEYETKINSGDIMLLAEVIRDLTRDIEDSERSYSERIIYETAIYRLTSEYVVIYGADFNESKDTIINTAKDKLGTEGKVTQKDEFDDEFDLIEKSRKPVEEDSDEEEDEESEEEDEEDDYDYDDDDDKPKKKKKK